MSVSSPAQNGQAAGSTTKFFGHDDTLKEWIVMSADDSGGYYLMRSVSPDFDGSRWRDVYPADGLLGYVRVINSASYAFDSEKQIGSTLTQISHTTCLRLL